MTPAKPPPVQALAVAQPRVHANALLAAHRALASTWIGYGPRCHQLEARFVRGRGGWALATQNCTAALWITATMLKQTPNDEVLIPSITFAPCATTFKLAGWHVTLCDVDPRTGILDLRDAASKISVHTRALLLVDVFGQRAGLEEARQLCDSSTLWLIRDAAHRLDLFDIDADVADFTCYSFGPTKEASCPDGGLLWSKHDAFEKMARALSWWGAHTDTWQRHRSVSHENVAFDKPFGMKLRSNDVIAAMTLAQLDFVENNRLARAALWNAYRRRLEVAGFDMASRNEELDSFLIMYVLVPASRRVHIRHALRRCLIGSSDHYPSLTTILKPPGIATCPHAEGFGATVITLPMHLDLNVRHIERICGVVEEAGIS